MEILIVLHKIHLDIFFGVCNNLDQIDWLLCKIRIDVHIGVYRYMYSIDSVIPTSINEINRS